MFKKQILTPRMIFLVTAILFSVAMTSCQKTENVRMGDQDSDYTNLGLQKGIIEPWEDGMRVDYTQDDFCFEWWYFDGTFEDGSSFVASFYSRIDIDPTKPFIKLTITTPEGENLVRSLWGDHSDSAFSTTECNLHIGEENSVTSENATTYNIKSKVDDIAVDLVLTRTVQSFRQDTGHIFIGDDETCYLAWFSMVPRGALSGTITYGGEEHTVTGMGYHDHNWGTIALEDCVAKWWWMRGYIDDIAIIAYDFEFNDTYARTHIPIYGVVNTTDVLASYDSSLETAIEGRTLGFPDLVDYSTNPADMIPFEIAIQTGSETDFEQGNNCLDILFTSEILIEAMDLLEVSDISDIEMFLAKLFGVSPWYLRYTGTVTLEALNFNGWTTSGTGTAIIEYLDLE